MYLGSRYYHIDETNPTGGYFDWYDCTAISLSVSSCNIDDWELQDLIINDNTQHWLGFMLNPLYRVFKPVFRLVCRSNGIRASPTKGLYGWCSCCNQTIRKVVLK